MQSLEKMVIRRFLGIGKDVVSSHPAKKNKPDQQEEKNGPPKESIGWLGAPAVTGVSVITVVVFSCHEIGGLKQILPDNPRQSKTGCLFNLTFGQVQRMFRNRSFARLED